VQQMRHVGGLLIAQLQRYVLTVYIVWVSWGAFGKAKKVSGEAFTIW
jgi:hypothetical protein